MLDFGFYNMDCLDGMREFPDNYFDLAVVDPPYGDGGYLDERNEIRSTIRQIPRTGFSRDTTLSEQGKTAAPTRTGGTWASKFGKK